MAMMLPLCWTFSSNAGIQTGAATFLGAALLATGFFPDNVTALKEQLRIFSDLVFEARGIRRAGAAAYDLCLVAEGVFDALVVSPYSGLRQ